MAQSRDSKVGRNTAGYAFVLVWAVMAITFTTVGGPSLQESMIWTWLAVAPLTFLYGIVRGDG